MKHQTLIRRIHPFQPELAQHAHRPTALWPRCPERAAKCRQDHRQRSPNRSPQPQIQGCLAHRSTAAASRRRLSVLRSRTRATTCRAALHSSRTASARPDPVRHSVCSSPAIRIENRSCSFCLLKVSFTLHRRPFRDKRGGNHTGRDNRNQYRRKRVDLWADAQPD